MVTRLQHQNEQIGHKVTQLQTGLDQARILAAIYRYALQHGQTLPDGAHEVDWRALCLALEPALRCSANDLERAASREPGVRLVVERGRIRSLLVAAG